MVIGLLTLDLHLPYSHSLKEKRMVVQRVKERLRNKFNVSVSEVDHQELWQRAALAVVSVSSSETNLRQVLQGAQGEASHLLGGDLIDSNIEIL